eukprot:14242660-Alexandrium_andersonii.AAC.1
MAVQHRCQQQKGTASDSRGRLAGPNFRMGRYPQVHPSDGRWLRYLKVSCMLRETIGSIKDNFGPHPRRGAAPTSGGCCSRAWRFLRPHGRLRHRPETRAHGHQAKRCPVGHRANAFSASTSLHKSSEAESFGQIGVFKASHSKVGQL